MSVPAARRSQSSHFQPWACAAAPRNSAASATRPVITTSAPPSSASTIGCAPRYADANNGSPGKSSKSAPDSEFVSDVPASRSSASRGLRSSPRTVAIRSPDRPSCFAVSIAARAAAVGLIPPAFVMSFVRPAATAGNALARYRGRSRV